MTISDLIRDRLDATGQSKTRAAVELGVTRPTLDAWLSGMYVPEPDHDRIVSISEWAEEPYARVLAIILLSRGIDPDSFPELVNFAKGV